MSNQLEILSATIMGDDGEYEQKYFAPDFNEIAEHTSELVRKLPDRKWKGILLITRGGLTPTGCLANQIEFEGDKIIETVGLGSYDTDKQGELRLVKDFNHDLVGDGEGWLLVDDLADTGASINYIKKLVPKAHVATVYTKPEGRDIADTYAYGVDQNVWIIFPWEDAAEDVPEWYKKIKHGNKLPFPGLKN